MAYTYSYGIHIPTATAYTYLQLWRTHSYSYGIHIPTATAINSHSGHMYVHSKEKVTAFIKTSKKEASYIVLCHPKGHFDDNVAVSKFIQKHCLISHSNVGTSTYIQKNIQRANLYVHIHLKEHYSDGVMSTIIQKNHSESKVGMFTFI